MIARYVSLALLGSVALTTACGPLAAAELRAGTAVVDVTDPRAEKVHDPALAKVLLLEQEGRRGVLVTIDVVAIGGIGPIGDQFLAELRERLAREHAIPPEAVIVNASHCHAAVCADVADRVVAAVAEAKQRLVAVKAGTGTASEARISENRRVDLVDGSQADMRRAYSMPADDAIAAIAPIDPQVGLLELDRLDGSPLAVVYLFACHPIMNPPRRGTSADFPAVASRVVEEALGGDTVAFFVQGCGGDINPVRYKEVDRPADAEPLGSMLGGTVLAGLARIETTADAPLLITSELVQLPRGTDFEVRIERLEAERAALVAGLTPTNISFEQFLPALVAQAIFPGDPGRSRQRTLHERGLAADGADETAEHDRLLAAEVAAYRNNIDAMERITRLTSISSFSNPISPAATRPTARRSTPRSADFGSVTFGSSPSLGSLSRASVSTSRRPLATRPPSSPATPTAISTISPPPASGPTPATPRKTATASWPRSGSRSSGMAPRGCF